MLLYVDSNFASPYALVAFVSLLEKGLTFDVEPLELFANAQREAGFASTSITSRVPTLVHDTFALSESSAICEYSTRPLPAPVFIRPTCASGPVRARFKRGCAAISCRFAKSVRHSSSSAAPRDLLFRPQRTKAAQKLFAAAFSCSTAAPKIYSASGRLPT